MPELGLTIYDRFTDSYGSDVRVQRATYPGEPRVWIFCTKGGYPPEGESPHLNVAQARRLRDALDAFIREQETPQAG